MALLLLALSQGCGGSAQSYGGYASPKMSRGPSRGGNGGVATVQASAPPSEESVHADRDGDGLSDNVDKESAANEPASAPMAPPMPSPGPAGGKADQRPLAEAPPKQQPGQPAPGKPDAKSPPDGRDAGSIADKRSPILIYTATFAMAVFEVVNSLNEVERITREAGGFIVKRTDKMATLRVPAPRFYEVVGRLEKLGDMLQRDVVAQDVTEEFLDTEVRLRNARAMRDRLAQLLAKANTVQDSLLIERELNRVAADIDRMEGRLKYLRDRAAFSTITISFEARRTETPPPSVRLPFSWLRSISLSRLLSL